MTRLILTGAILASMALNAVGQVTNPNPPSPPLPYLQTCSDLGDNFPISKGSSPSCCRQGADIFHVALHPGQPLADKGVVHRQIGLPCTTPDTTNCVGRECHFGPCGAYIVGAWDGTQAVVFEPALQGCGYQVTRNPGHHVIVAEPEPFNGQVQYSGVVASCPYTACVAAGRPAVLFTVNVVRVNATGQTSIEPENITLTGAANLTLALEQDGPVTVTAVPTGRYTKAEFAGACHNTGLCSKTITCTMPFRNPNTTVTVTYRSSTSLSCLVNTPVDH